MKEGIEYVARDKRQPYRVWYNNRIIFFAHTLLEADMKLQKERLLHETYNKQKELK